MTTRLADLLGGLTLGCDVLSGFPPGKVLRTVVLAVHVGRAHGLDDATLRDAFVVNLLRYLGCTGFAHEEAHHYGAGDDRLVRNVMAMADASEPAATLTSIVRRVGAGASLRERVVGVARLLGDGVAVDRHARAQCDASARMAAAIGAGPGVLAALAQICERWDGRGAPARAGGEALEVPIRLHHLADRVEVAHHRGGREAAVELLRRRSGGLLDPALVATAVREADALFEAIEAPDLWERFLDAEPRPHELVDDDRVDRVLAAIGRFVDLKSVSTLGHSDGVARLASAAASALGLDDDTVRLVRRAGQVHDLGRLTVPNGVWDRRGPLDPAAWEQVRLHAYWTDRILSRAPSLKAIAHVASSAHERLDGEGYPRAVPATVLGRAARVLAAADVAHALGEDRPHRPARSREQAAAVLADEVRAGRLDREAVDAVLGVLGLPSTSPRRTPLTEREAEVLRLVARGKTNAEIGTLLGISVRTAGNHVAHIYDKIGAYSRAGAALYAMEHGLFE